MDTKYTIFGWQGACFQNAEHFSDLPPLPPPDFIKINLFNGLSLKKRGAARGRQGGGRGRQGGGKSAGGFPAPWSQRLGISTKSQKRGRRRSGGGKVFFPARVQLETLRVKNAGPGTATGSGKTPSLTLSFPGVERRRLKCIKGAGPASPSLSGEVDANVNISIEMAESPTAQNVKVCGKEVSGERDIRGLQAMKWKNCAVRIGIQGGWVSGGPGGGVPPYERYGGSGPFRRRVGSLKWGGFV